jgi:hypothetical protein
MLREQMIKFLEAAVVFLLATNTASVLAASALVAAPLTGAGQALAAEPAVAATPWRVGFAPVAWRDRRSRHRRSRSS